MMYYEYNVYCRHSTHIMEYIYCEYYCEIIVIICFFKL